MHGETTRLDGLQIARALAALSVAYFHSWRVTMPFPAGTDHPIPWLKAYGGGGVEFFFALSGFVICLLVTSPRFDARSFVIKRLFRLWPLWIATSVVYLHLTDLIGRSEAQTWRAFWYSLTLLPTNGFPFYDIGWSLQHEIAFYVLAAIVVPRFGLIALPVFLGCAVLLDNIVTLPWYLHQYFGFYGYFMAGIAAYAVRTPLASIGVVIPIATGAALFYVLPVTLQPVAIFPLLIAAVNLKPAGLLGGVMTELGNASYSIYLIHPIVFSYIYAYLQPPLPPNWIQEPLRYTALAAVCLISLVTLHVIERPMIAIGEFLARLIYVP